MAGTEVLIMGVGNTDLPLIEANPVPFVGHLSDHLVFQEWNGKWGIPFNDY